MFMPGDLQQLKKYVWQTETPTSAYMLQCEGVIRAKMSSASPPENVAADVEQLLLRPPRPLAAWTHQEDLTDPAAWLLRAGQAFLYFISHTVSKLEEVENLKQVQADLQTLYCDYMGALERAAVAEKWTAKDILETNGVAKEKMLWAQQELTNQVKFRKAAAAHTQFNRREKALGQLMSDVSIQADRGDATALVESIEQLHEESCLLDSGHRGARAGAHGPCSGREGGAAEDGSQQVCRQGQV